MTQVLLVDDNDRVLGTMDKAVVHTRDTPLHRAFSCYLFDPAGRLLVSRRALSKKTWPGVWSNSVCGHPEPGEDLADAMRRRASEELGIDSVSDLRVVLPTFRYVATAADGTVENEICPVAVGRVTGHVAFDPGEVMETAWTALPDWHEAAVRTPFVLSPWTVLQTPLLVRLRSPG